MASRFLTILTGHNLPEIWQSREAEPSIINEKTVADFTRVVEQTGIRASHHGSGDRKALTKELSKSRAMTKIFAERSAEQRREGEALIREADNLSCQSWNERMWSDGSPIDPSPTIDQAINGGYGLVGFHVQIVSFPKRNHVI
jgi:hypothetical protein